MTMQPHPSAQLLCQIFFVDPYRRTKSLLSKFLLIDSFYFDKYSCSYASIPAFASSAFLFYNETLTSLYSECLQTLKKFYVHNTIYHFHPGNWTLPALLKYLTIVVDCLRDHSLFMAGGGLVRMKGGGAPKILGSLRGCHRKYANRCVRGSLAI